MNYKEIEELLKKNKLKDLELKYADVFDRVTTYIDLFTQGTIDNYYESDKALKELMGLFISLSIPCSILENEREFKKLSIINNLKQDKINTGEKVPGMNLLEKESELLVYEYTRMKNIFFTHRAICDRAISVCQSSLKFMSKEKYQ